jgi:hypothetical protein
VDWDFDLQKKPQQADKNMSMAAVTMRLAFFIRRLLSIE